jgi:hypothetical protein
MEADSLNESTVRRRALRRGYQVRKSRTSRSLENIDAFLRECDEKAAQ